MTAVIFGQFQIPHVFKIKIIVPEGYQSSHDFRNVNGTGQDDRFDAGGLVDVFPEEIFLIRMGSISS